MNTEWYNYKTEEFSVREPDTDDIARQYIPQDISSQELYTIYRELGDSILYAIIKVLKVNIGQKPIV